MQRQHLGNRQKAVTFTITLLKLCHCHFPDNRPAIRSPVLATELVTGNVCIELSV